MRNTAPFTPEDKTFLKMVRDDIAARPSFYQPGIAYLARRFSEDALHTEDQKDWEEFKNHPTQIASNRAAAARAAWQSTWPDDEPDERDRIERQVFQQVAAPPGKDERYALSNRLIRAFSTMLREGLDTPDDDLNPYDLDKAKAVVCLTWLVTDRDADQLRLGVSFGPWLAAKHDYAGLPTDGELALKIAARGRSVARMATLDETSGPARQQWMALARQAWQLLLDHREKWVSGWLVQLGIQSLLPADQLTAVLSELVNEAEAHEPAMQFVGNHALMHLANHLAAQIDLGEPFFFQYGDGGFLLTVFAATGGGSTTLALPRPLLETQSDAGSISEKQQLLASLRAWQRHLGRHQQAKAAESTRQSGPPFTGIDSGGSAPTDGHFTSAELAARYKVDAEAARKALERWRKKHAGGDGYTENPDRRPNEPQFLYSLKAIEPVMEGLKSRAARRTKMSGARPAQ